MKVLHVSLWDSRGGAAIAASRLHLGLIDQGIDSRMLVARAEGNVPKVDLLRSGWGFQLDRAQEKLSYYVSKSQLDESLFACSLNLRFNNLIKRINEINPDVVHLHWVGGGMLRIEDLPKIKQPIVWTLHDMWPFCGSEHYSLGDSERWKKAYTNKSRAEQAKGLDLTRRIWFRKIQAWTKVSLASVSPSLWMQECATNSSLWKDNQHVRHACIHNGLDTDLFKPIEKAQARRDLGLSADLPILLFGAHSINSHVKGGDLLCDALRLALSKGFKFQLVTFGSGETSDIAGVRMTHLGRISDASKLSKIYSVADVMLVPSRIESFGQVACEALSCGTPVLCFDTSGLKDVVDHLVCGYRAECFSIDDYVRGLEWLLGIDDKELISAVARQYVLKKFQIVSAVEAYVELYDKQLERSNA
jgi:glycosyltransferase involved in cell wall biosynthesis